MEHAEVLINKKKIMHTHTHTHTHILPNINYNCTNFIMLITPCISTNYLPKNCSNNMHI